MPKTIVITGASDGIGAAAARRLHADGHRVVVVGRDPDKTAAVAREIHGDWHVADFTRLDEVRRLAATLSDEYPRIDVLANNAGGVFGGKTITVDGHEKTFQVNHLAPYLLTTLLLDTLLRSRATVVQTSSVAARLYGRLDLGDIDDPDRYSPDKAYGDAKLANILFTRELHRRYHDDGLDAAAFHPGFIASSFASDTTSLRMRMVYNPLGRRLIRSPDRGADQLVWMSQTSAGDAWESGAYYESRHAARRSSPQASDAGLALGLWELSAALVAVH